MSDILLPDILSSRSLFFPLPFTFENDVSLQLLIHVASFVDGLSGTM